MQRNFWKLILFISWYGFLLAGCVGPKKQPTKSTPAPSGSVRMTVNSILVPKKAEDFSREITDEAEKYGISGFVWTANPDELRLVIEGDKESVEEFFNFVLDLGNKLHVIASYSKPKWSKATGDYGYFIRTFTPDPPE